MFKYSFYRIGGEPKTTIEDAIKFVEETNKPFVYTYGLEYRRPATHRVPKDRDWSITKVHGNGMIDVVEEDNVVHIKEVSANDMW